MNPEPAKDSRHVHSKTKAEFNRNFSTLRYKKRLLKNQRY